MSYGWAASPANVREQTRGVAETLRETLGEALVGVYLHGSLAMGAFQPERSDIDVIAVVDGELSSARRTKLASALLRLSGHPHAVELHVVEAGALRRWRHPCPFLFHYSEAWRGRFEAAEEAGGDDDWQALPAFAGDVDADLAAHVRVVRERGVAIRGRAVEATFPDVPDADMRAAVLADVDVPFRDVSKQPVDYVLNLLRAIRFCTDGAVLSKEEAGVWGLGALPFHIEVVADALSLYRRPAPRESLHFDVEPLRRFLRSCRWRLDLPAE